MIVNEFCNCYAFRQISSKMTKIYDEALLISGLKITQFAILKYINILKITNLNNLATSMSYNRSTLGRNIRILERKKLIYLNTGKNKREIEISMTNKGLKVLKVSRKCWEEINKQITKKLGINKKKMIDELMNDKFFKTRGSV